MLTDIEKEYICSAINRDKFQENDRIDFKLKWYEQNNELVKDLLSFVNTYHHNNCYIVIGIEDETKKIVGVNRDDHNRKNTQQLTDLIGSLHLAQNSYFSVEIDSFNIESKVIDVIIIENSIDTPFFLSKDYKGLKKGLIYCRRKDINTSNDKIASDKEIENLYKKRFHMDQDVFTQFKYLLQDCSSWNKCESIDGQVVIFHKKRPDYCIKIIDDEIENRINFESFSINEIHAEITYYILELSFHNIILKRFTLIGLDECRKFLIWPKFSASYSYYYEYEDSIEYYISILLNHRSEENPYRSVVVYRDKFEKDKIEKNLTFNISNNDIKNEIEKNRHNFNNIDKINYYELEEVIKRYLRVKKRLGHK